MGCEITGFDGEVLDKEFTQNGEVGKQVSQYSVFSVI